MMKILEILGSGQIGITANDPGSNIVCELSNNFVHLGHDVTIADVKSNKERNLLDSRVKVFEANVPSPHLDTKIRKLIILNKLVRKTLSYSHLYPHYQYLCGLIPHYKYVREVATKLRLDSYDIIHVQHGQHAIFLLKLYHKSYVYTNHWQYSPNDNNLDARIERMVIRGARTAVGVGSYLKLFEPLANHVIIPHGIDPEKWKPLGRKECREVLGISEKDFIVVFVGRVDHGKGVDILLKAIQSLTSQYKHFRLYIIGNLSPNKYSTNVSSYAHKLIEQSKGSPVYFLGFMDNMSMEFRRYLSAADVFVLPSRWEAQGLVVLEALAMGLPAIVSDVGGLGEMINKEIGYTFKSEDSEELAQIIQHLCDDSKQLETLQKNCRNYVEKHYSWKSVALRYIDAFRDCIDVQVLTH